MKKLLYVLFAWFVALQCAFAAVNINTASQEELDKLPGVGPVKAQAIIEERSKNGPFKNIEDIKRVKGIGDATFEKMKSEISVTGAGSSHKAEAKPEAKAETKHEAKPETKHETKAVTKSEPAVEVKPAKEAKEPKAVKEVKEMKDTTADDKTAAKKSKKDKEDSADKKDEKKDAVKDDTKAEKKAAKKAKKDKEESADKKDEKASSKK